MLTVMIVKSNSFLVRLNLWTTNIIQHNHPIVPWPKSYMSNDLLVLDVIITYEVSLAQRLYQKNLDPPSISS